MVSPDINHKYPENVGIIAMESYFPSTYVDQTELGTKNHCDHFWF